MSNPVFSDTLGGMRKTIAFVALFASVLAISACSSGVQTKDTTPVMSLTPISKLIDVRTVEEFADGHVQGAHNADVESGAFQEFIASLDKEASYSLYCRSGRRSAIAANLMAQAGFTKVTDLGDLESAATTLGLPIVTK